MLDRDGRTYDGRLERDERRNTISALQKVRLIANSGGRGGPGQSHIHVLKRNIIFFFSFSSFLKSFSFFFFLFLKCAFSRQVAIDRSEKQFPFFSFPSLIFFSLSFTFRFLLYSFIFCLFSIFFLSFVLSLPAFFSFFVIFVFAILPRLTCTSTLTFHSFVHVAFFFFYCSWSISCIRTLSLSLLLSL